MSRLLLLAATVLASGALSAAPAAADPRDRMLDGFQFDALKADIRALPDGPERAYFSGMIANAEGRLDASARDLTKALPGLRAARPDRAARALQALADDDTKLFRYADAAASDDDLLAHFSGALTPAQLQGARDDDQLFHVLAGAPAQTLDKGSVALRTARDRFGLLETQLGVNGVEGAWVLDTGANMSVVTESFAQKLGLTPLPGVAQAQAGLTGIENPMHLALVPNLPFGGATLHNVVVLVMPDDNLNLPYDKDGHRFQINAIIGYPVFQALGRVTFRQDGALLAGDGDGAASGGAPLYMKQLTPVITGVVEGRTLSFSLDTGASQTELFVTYLRRFQAEASGWKTVDFTSAGAGGTVKRKLYVQDEVKIGVGDRTAVLRHVIIDMTDAGTDTGGLYGNLGQDLFAGFDSFTLDFEHMRFSLGKPLAPAGTKP